MLDKLGFAFIVVVDNNIVYQAKYSVSAQSTVFKYEVLAIAKAIDFIIAHNLENVYIRTDSLSALQALTGNCGIPLIKDLRNKILGIKSKVHLTWVQAHVGEFYNEFVDSLAKEATRKDSIDFQVGYSVRQVKTLLFKEATHSWQEEWDNLDKGRHVYDYFSSVNIKRLEGNFYINQIYTGHGAIPVYQARFKGKRRSCWCGAHVGTLHLIYECCKVDHIRTVWFPVNFKNVTIKNLCTNAKSRQGLCLLIEFFLKLCMDNL